MSRNTSLVAVLALILCACTPSVEWKEGPVGADGRARHTLVLRHMPEGGRIWFQELFDNHQTLDTSWHIRHFQGTSFYLDLPKGGTHTIVYDGRPLPRHSWAPEGFVLQRQHKEDLPLTVKYSFLEHPYTEPEADWFVKDTPLQATDILPRVKNAEAPEHPEGWYRLTLDAQGQATVEADDPDGAFYAQVTLSKLPEGCRDLSLEDWPDLKLRGFMLDVVRNFRSKEEVFQVLDIMASYKLNLLHFHLGDDESWCLEIPQIPELTTFGAHHELPDWDLKERRGLKPQACGLIGIDTYYSEADYKEILRYAWERRIRVVPEFDAPGHSRAAIRSVEVYEQRTGDGSYRLQDPADTSHYWSAQDFKDNVLDPDLPGVYKFYGLVFDQVIRLHQEAGVPLLAVHIGGDEVPGGTWAGRDRHQLKDRFTRGILQLARERSLLLAGWQEIVQGIAPETLESLKPQLLFVNAWDTRDENADLACRLANDGIPVLMSNVEHAYVDLAYSDNPAEIGLHWGGYVDEIRSFALQPFREPLLRPENIVGAEALLWSENLRGFRNTTYQMLPKALGVWERTWNAHPDWADDAAFKEDFGRFYSIIAQKEIPRWEAAGYCYKKR